MGAACVSQSKKREEETKSDPNRVQSCSPRSSDSDIRIPDLSKKPDKGQFHFINHTKNKDNKNNNENNKINEDIPQLNTQQWLQNLSHKHKVEISKLAKSHHFKKLVPQSNQVDNLENDIKYIKTLGKGASCKVVLATYKRRYQFNNSANQSPTDTGTTIYSMDISNTTTTSYDENKSSHEGGQSPIGSKNGKNNNNNKKNSGNRRQNSNLADIDENKIEEMIGKNNRNSNNANARSVNSNENENKNNGDEMEAPNYVLSLNNNDHSSFGFLKSEPNERFALKQMCKNDKDCIIKFTREANILNLLNHPNIVSIITCYMDKENYYIATKFCYGGALLDFILQCNHFSEQQASYYIKSILDAIKYIHSKNIVHRDLKPGNIMFNKIPILNTDGSPGFANDAKLIIIDFGEAIQVEKDTVYDDRVGTMIYVPPEVVRSRKGWELKGGDIWSIGVIAYILLCGKAPFKGKNFKETLRLIGTQRLQWPDANSQQTHIKSNHSKDRTNTNKSKSKAKSKSKPNPCSQSIAISKRGKEFVEKLLTKLPKTRATAEEALKHPWITDNVHNPCDMLNNVKNKDDKSSATVAKSQLVSNIADFHHAGMCMVGMLQKSQLCRLCFTVFFCKRHIFFVVWTIAI